MPDKQFAGTDRSQKKDGPVQFEKDDDDFFGLAKFLQEAKQGAKRHAPEDRGSSRYDRKRERRD